MKIYSIRNRLLSYSNRPFYFESDEEALQYVLNVLTADSDRTLSNLKGDLDLECIGEIDFSLGKITSTERYRVSDLSAIWDHVPVDRIPRDSLKLSSDISNVKSDVNKLSDRVDSLVTLLSTHFKFMRGKT